MECHATKRNLVLMIGIALAYAFFAKPILASEGKANLNKPALTKEIP